MNGSNLSGRLSSARGAVVGLSARELSSLAGLSNAACSRLENENRPRPAARTVGALARALGVELLWLLDGTGPCVAALPTLDPDNDNDWPAIAEHITRTVERARARVAHAADAVPDAVPGEIRVVREGYDQTGTGG